MMAITTVSLDVSVVVTAAVITITAVFIEATVLLILFVTLFLDDSEDLCPDDLLSFTAKVIICGD
jgi:hypothetical protein